MPTPDLTEGDRASDPDAAGAGTVRRRPSSGKDAPTSKKGSPEQGSTPPDGARLQEPVWLVRITLLLFLVGFATFLAREVWRVVEAFA